MQGVSKKTKSKVRQNFGLLLLRKQSGSVNFCFIQASLNENTDPLKTGDGGDPEGEGAGGAGGEDGEEGAQEALHEVEDLDFSFTHI